MSEPIPSATLPSGWECKFDQRSGRYYFINHFTQTTTWEDPRLRYRSYIQTTPQMIQTTPQHTALPYDAIPLQDLTNMRPSPIPSRAYVPLHPMPSYGPPPLSYHTETTLSHDTEQSVAKISAMFPTVGETHIRALLKKYHNRETVVMSALQVEKHPISTPGPFATPPLGGIRSYQPGVGVISAYGLATPPPSAIAGGAVRAPISAGGSPVIRPFAGPPGAIIISQRVGDAFRNSPRPHSSPKMKLRYLKSVFPTVEETFLLDILCNADNNVQKATEKLLVMGFEKRDTPPPRLTIRKKEEEPKPKTVIPTPPPRMKSQEEKQKMKNRLQEKYKDIPERVVTIALDSVDYDEERAGHILNMMVQEESKAKSTELKSTEKDRPMPENESSAPTQTSGPVPLGASPTHKSVMIRKPVSDKTDKGQHRRPKGKKDVPKVSRGTSTTEDKEHKSPYLSKVTGPNPDLHKGPNDELLLVDYVTWNGPNSNYCTSKAGKMSKGVNFNLRQGSSNLAKGPNQDMFKGPVKNLAKGSIYCKTAA
ncbi:uncharacterized protein [Hetaerina americana]|uniref:uncharacterized protein isoform X1 n=1 Tax=Hetaerina americana TaxID=62018 RepID=UPI003A7F42C0